VTLVPITVACVLIEIAQSLRPYEAHYDPFDFLAYVSLLIPGYPFDRWLLSRRTGPSRPSTSVVESDHA
jgi:hypothetical protein